MFLPRESHGLKSLVGSGPQGLKEWDVTEQLSTRSHPSFHCVSQTLLLLLLCHFSRVRVCVTPWTAAHQAPQSLGFSRQEHWSGLSFPSPGDLPNQGIKPSDLHLLQFLHWQAGKNTVVGCHFLLQKIFPTQGLNPDLPHCRQMLYRLSHQGSY